MNTISGLSPKRTIWLFIGCYIYKDKFNPPVRGNRYMVLFINYIIPTSGVLKCLMHTCFGTVTVWY